MDLRFGDRVWGLWFGGLGFVRAWGLIPISYPPILRAMRYLVVIGGLLNGGWSMESLRERVGSRT